ncbi:HEAT repeat domain-containing protein [Streptomyces sp. NBC_01381]|uniref:HEAT repeat domain-containing protein n=1 Tax=Streptomyces sp. NBC_01381 TaxID=2903845 RepID=UPI002255720A|nr:HEAT repeat domain-containing protein [Streptomyces sp. NBC_01381]MCX4671593.1 HEAT repeat domain-containing protein [Streptomyces sp. NBC_01381]
MFKKRKARLQAELHEDLAGALRDADPEVRGKAAGDMAETAELGWALRELALAVEREPSTQEPFLTLAVGLANTLRRHPTLRERTERIFAGHLDDPHGFVREWTGLMAELGGGPAVRMVDTDLRDDMAGRLDVLRGEGWTEEGLSGGGRHPDSVAYHVAFGASVIIVCSVIRRNEPLTATEADRIRAETRAVLERALPLPPGGDERSELTVPLAVQPDEESWSDRARHGLRTDEALAWCASTEPDRVTLGVELLADLLLFGDTVRSEQIVATLDRLVREEPQPLTLTDLMNCYGNVHVSVPLQDPPFQLFFDGLSHPDDRVRTEAASGLESLAPGTPEEGRAVAGLIEVLDHDSENGVRRMAAESLAGMKWVEERNSWAAVDALERHADSPVAEIRAQSLRDAIQRGTPDAYDWLLREFENPDVSWHFISAYTIASLGDDFLLPSDIRPAFVERLERLATSGWADRCEDPDAYPDAEDRAEMLDEILRDLRADAR